MVRPESEKTPKSEDMPPDPNNPLYRMKMEPTWFYLDTDVTIFACKLVYADTATQIKMAPTEISYRLFRPIEVFAKPTEEGNKDLEASELCPLGERTQIVFMPKSRVVMSGLLDEVGVKYYKGAIIAFDIQREEFKGILDELMDLENEEFDDDDEMSECVPGDEWKNTPAKSPKTNYKKPEVKPKWDKDTGPFGNRWDFLNGQN